MTWHVMWLKKTRIFTPIKFSGYRSFAATKSVLGDSALRHWSYPPYVFHGATCLKHWSYPPYVFHGSTWFQHFCFDHWPLKVMPLHLLETCDNEHPVTESSIPEEQSCLFLQTFFHLSYILACFLASIFPPFSYPLFIRSALTFFPFLFSFLYYYPSFLPFPPSRLSSLSLF